MIYPYHCNDCAANFEVIKRVAAIDNPERCPHCDSEKTYRYLAKSQSFYGADDWNSQQYSPALGKWVKSKKELREEAKRRNLIEIGTEKPENIHKWSEETNNAIQEARWNSLDDNLGEVKSG